LTTADLPMPSTRDGYGTPACRGEAPPRRPRASTGWNTAVFRNVYLYITGGLPAAVRALLHGRTTRPGAEDAAIADRRPAHGLAADGRHQAHHPRRRADTAPRLHRRGPLRRPPGLRARHHHHQRAAAGAAEIPADVPEELRLRPGQPGRRQRRLPRRRPRSGNVRRGPGDDRRADRARVRHPHHLHRQPGQPRRRPCACSTSPTNSASAWSSTTCSRPSGPDTATRTWP